MVEVSAIPSEREVAMVFWQVVHLAGESPGPEVHSCKTFPAALFQRVDRMKVFRDNVGFDATSGIPRRLSLDCSS